MAIVRKMWDILGRLYIEFTLFFIIIIVLFISVPFSWLSRNRTNHFRKWAKIGLKLGFFLTGIRIKIEGWERIPGGPIVFASNHRSLLDTLSILTLFNRPFFVITEPLGAMPNFFIQRWTENLGFIPIIRDETDQKLHKVGMSRHYVVPLCVDRVKKGESIVIYPEAHHERRKGLLKFKTGAIRIALEARTPVIPVALTGTEKVVTPDHFKIHHGNVHVRIGEPMELKRFYGKQKDKKLVKKLTQELKKQIGNLIPNHLK